MAVRLHRHDAGTGLGQGQRERAQAGSDLEHVGARPGAREAGDASHRVRVGHEVLTEGPTGLDPVRRQQLSDVGAGMGHQEIVTSATP